MNITVYTLPACVQCDTTKRYLTNQGLEFEEVNLAEDSAAYEMIREKGFTAAPVVIAEQADHGTEAWSGFRLEKLQKLTYDAKTATVHAAA